MTLPEMLDALKPAVNYGINWTWATWPASDPDAQSKAEQFEAWCDAHGYENRGVYPPSPAAPTWGVRYR